MPDFPSTLKRIFHLLLFTLYLSCLCHGHVLQQRTDEDDLNNEILRILAEYEGVNSQELEQLPDFIPSAVESVDSLSGLQQISSQIPGREEIQPAPFTLNMHVFEDINDVGQDQAYFFDNLGGDSIIFGLVASNGLWMLTINNDYALSVYNPKERSRTSAEKLRKLATFKISIGQMLLGIPYAKPQPSSSDPQPQNLHDFAEQVVRQGGWMVELVVVEEIYKPSVGRAAAVHQSLITATGDEILAYLKSNFDQGGVKFTRVPWRRSEDASTPSDTQFGMILFHSDGGPDIGEPGWKAVAYYGSELGAYVEIGDASNDDPEDECADAMQVDDKWPQNEINELWNAATKFTPSSPSTPLAELVFWPGDDTPGHQGIQGYANNIGSTNGIVILVLTTKGYWALTISGTFIVENGLQKLGSVNYDKNNAPGMLRLRSKYLGEQIAGQPEAPVDMNLVRAVQLLREKGASLWDIIILSPSYKHSTNGRIRNVAFADAILSRVKELTKSLYSIDENGVQQASFIRSPALRGSTYNKLVIQSIYQDDLGGRLAGQKGILFQIFYYQKLQLRTALEENGAGFEVYVFEMSRFTIGDAKET